MIDIVEETDSVEEVDATVERAAELLKVTIDIVRDRRQDHNMRFDLVVLKDQNSYFTAALTDVLKKMPEGTKIKVEDVTDAETKKPCKLLLSLSGSQEAICRVLNQNGRSIMQHCVTQ